MSHLSLSLKWEAAFPSPIWSSYWSSRKSPGWLWRKRQTGWAQVSESEVSLQPCSTACAQRGSTELTWMWQTSLKAPGPVGSKPEPWKEVTVTEKQAEGLLVQDHLKLFLFPSLYWSPCPLSIIFLKVFYYWLCVWISMDKVHNLVLFQILIELLSVFLHLSWCWLWPGCTPPSPRSCMSLVSLIAPERLSGSGVECHKKVFSTLKELICDFSL